jgi:hypothetical protein
MFKFVEKLLRIDNSFREQFLESKMLQELLHFLGWPESISPAWNFNNSKSLFVFQYHCFRVLAESLYVENSRFRCPERIPSVNAELFCFVVVVGIFRPCTAGAPWAVSRKSWTSYFGLPASLHSHKSHRKNPSSPRCPNTSRALAY